MDSTVMTMLKVGNVYPMVSNAIIFPDGRKFCNSGLRKFSGPNYSGKSYGRKDQSTFTPTACLSRHPLSAHSGQFLQSVAVSHPLQHSHQLPRRCRIVTHASTNEASSSGDREDDDGDTPESVGDWREFRARLIRSSMNITDPEVQSSPSAKEEEASATATSSSAEGGVSGEGTPGYNKFERERERWAHALVQPEAGCLVIANPAAFGLTQTYFNQAVIFLFAHGPDGSAGVILNRPTEYTLGQLPGFEKLLPEFQNCPLYMGGDVGQNCTHVVHGMSTLEGSKEIISGVFIGGYDNLTKHIRSGKSSAMDYRWFARYSGWGPGQLEREVNAGVWYLGSASKDIILNHCLNLPIPLWRQVLELMGGEYADVARRTYGEV